ncbi:MAG TPA: hypothetical protein VNZ03_20605 [Terriglobales bacterium]|nr:hypothetical protein [Terriglobales bacterium]
MLRSHEEWEITKGVVPISPGEIGLVDPAFVICTTSLVRDIVELVMVNFPHSRRKLRAPRVNLFGNASATIQLENGRQLWGKTHRISTTGGLLELATCLDEGVKVSLIVHLGARTVRGRAAMLFPMWATQGYMQPFRFTDLREEECVALQSEIGELLKQAKPLASVRRGFGFRPQNFLESS